MTQLTISTKKNVPQVSQVGKARNHGQMRQKKDLKFILKSKFTLKRIYLEKKAKLMQKTVFYAESLNISSCVLFKFCYLYLKIRSWMTYSHC